MYAPAEMNNLTAKEVYRMELAQLPAWTKDEEWVIVEEARAGNAKARQHLIESCLPYIIGVATAYASLHKGEDPLDFMDVIAAGNLRVVARIDAALQAPNPCGFLRQAAHGAMADYCAEKKTTIKVPARSYWRGKRAGTVLSLDAPLSYDSDLTLADLIEA
jgi:DNA-directed RNA polymerase specialized sigma subunit